MKDIFAKKDKRSELEKEYDEMMARLRDLDPLSDEYEKMKSVVTDLHTLLMEEKDHKKTVSPDAIFGGLVNLLGIGFVLKHEELHNITSKAFSLISKGRVR